MIERQTTFMLALALTAGAPAFADDPIVNASESSTAEEMLGPPNTGDRRPPIEPAKPTIDASGAKVEDQGPNRGRLHLKVGNDITTAYFSRGTLIENAGFIDQPYAQVTLDAWKAESFTLSPFIGVWNSFHSIRTAATTTQHFIDAWYESDPYAGVQLVYGQWTGSVSYYFLNAPNGGWGSSEELWLNASYDDSELLGAWSMKPGLTLVFETGQNSAHAPNNGDYLQLDLSPGVAWEGSPIGQVDFTFPVQVGVGLSDFYEDVNGDAEFFGFASVGAKAAFKLPVHRDLGVWTMNVGGNVIFLGNHNTDYNNNTSVAFVGTLGLSIEY